MPISFDPGLFEDELENAAPTSTIRAAVTVPVIRQTARVTSQSYEHRRDYLTRDPNTWTWDDLRNYVVGKIQEMHGDFPRNEGKEFGIFSAFAGRFDDMAGPIAKWAFETSPTPGFWKGSPISVTRFCKASDEYFGLQIQARISQV